MNDPNTSRYVDTEALAEELLKINPGLALSTGLFEIPSHCEARDLDWNHMDQEHRPHIHRTYGEVSRVFTEKNVAVSVTRVPFGPLKLFFVVTDMRLGPGRFYQCFTLLGLFYVHVVNHNTNEKMSATWHVLSHRTLRFLHPILHRRLHRLIQTQNNEDLPIRKRRAELRGRGYSFGTDAENYLNSNTNSPNTVYPPVTGTYRFALQSVSDGKPTKVTQGTLELLIRREGNGAYRIWNAVCPHEGGPLEFGNLCGEGKDMKCPWHGLRFQGLLLNHEAPEASLGPLFMRLEGDALLIRGRDT